MSQSSLRELGVDFLVNRQFERALGVFAEAVRRQPADYRARMLAARCLSELGESERAVTALYICAEALLKRDYLLSAIAACRSAIDLSPAERRLKDTLLRIHRRAARGPGRAAVPPPLPPENLYEGKVEEDLMTLEGELLSNRAIEVLSAPDPGAAADPEARPPLPLFADLEDEAFCDLVSVMNYRTVAQGEIICAEGQDGESIFVLVAGKAEVTRQLGGEEKTLGYLSGGSIFGELSVLTGAPPAVTVTAVVDTELFEIKREHLNQVAKGHPTASAALAEFARQRMAKNLFATSPLFKQLPESEREALFGRFHFRALMPHEKALVEGEHSPGLFLVLAGELSVQKADPAGGAVTLGTLRDGEVAGEISLLSGSAASATVLSNRKTATAFLERAAFAELIEAFPNIKTYLEGLSDTRLKQIGEALKPAEIIDADELVILPEDLPLAHAPRAV